VNIKPSRHRFGFSLAWDWQLSNSERLVNPPHDLIGLIPILILDVSDSDWKGKCGVPGLGVTSLNNIYKEPSSLWLDSSFSFPNLKVLKDDANVSKELSNSEKGYTYDNANKSWTKRIINRVKSLPTENITARQEDPTKQVKLFNSIFGHKYLSSLICRVLKIFI
jgi:hypothetical protein